MRMEAAVLALALSVALTACGGEEGEAAPSVSLLGQAAGVEDTAVVAVVDGREIPAWHYLYWLDFTCTRLGERYREAEIPLDWDAPLAGEEGKTLADYAKEQALADTALYATVETWAETYDCGLTEEDEAEAAERWREECAAHGGEASYLVELAAQGLDRERAEVLTGTGLLYGKLYRLYHTEGSALSALAPGASGLIVDRIFAAAGEDREAAHERAAEFFSRLNSAADQNAAFEALAAEGDDHEGPRLLSPGVLPASLEEAAGALEEGQFSGILEAEDGFSILRCLPDGGSLSDGTVEPEEDAFDQLLESAAAQAEIETTEVYDAISPAGFCEALSRGRSFP